ncbi:MAG: insulinase family protein [Chloroflexota bacterium]|nr:insulinase family protein [Chloroflexota bacterium]
MHITFEKFRLANGLEVILHQDRGVPVAAVNVWYHVGSQNEQPHRTGFAHLFEHIMFKGSKHHNREYFLPLQEIGASLNGSTTTDRTNYFEVVPADYLELALWLESDRMGFLLDALDEARFAVEREVVKNERRQSYENRPYGLASQEIRKALFPPHHPYHWQTIGSQEHLDAASIEDVKAFFSAFYAPNNASLCIGGDIDPEETRRLVERYFGDLAPAPAVARIERWMPELQGEVRLRLEDRVQLQRTYRSWVAPPRFDPDEAPLDVLMSLLGEGRSSRLYRSLVYDRQIAREVNARYEAMEIAGEVRLDATVNADRPAGEVERALDAQLERLQAEPPAAEEVQRAINRLEAQYVRQLERIGSRADTLNYFNVFAGDPERLNRDFDRYSSVTPGDVQRVARHYLTPGCVRLVVAPRGELAATAGQVDRSMQPGAGRPRDFRPPSPRRLRLSGDVDVLVVEKHEVPIVATAIYFSGGALADPDDRPGLSFFTGRLLTEGTSTRSSIEIAEQSDFIAARLNLGTHRENLAATTTVLAQHWPAALELLADVLANPVFPEREVERVRKELLTDLRRLRDDANAVADRVSAAVLYGRDTAYGHPVGGREPSISGIARAELVSQHRRTIERVRPTILVVGDVDTEAAVRLLERAFGSWRPASAPAPAPEQPAAEGPRTTIFVVDKPGAAQSVISAGRLSVPRLHPDYLPLVVMNMAFGGQFTARLNMNLREAKGYTYGYRSHFDWRLGRSSFLAGGAVHTAVTKEAVAETLRELRDVSAERPLAEDEFDKARSGLVRGYPPTFETAGQVLGRLTDLVHFGLPDDYYAGQLERLQAITLEEVRRAAREHLRPEGWSIVVVGDRTAIEPGLGELGFPLVQLNPDAEPVAAAP